MKAKRSADCDSRILLVHWNRAEAGERAQELTTSGHRVKILSTTDTRDLGKVRASPPELFLIDLSRLPSHGRELASYFRRLKATRAIPIVFVGGEAKGIESARRLLPDAHFAQWNNIGAAIRRARRNPSRNPVVPKTMDAYSNSPLPKKLGIRENHAVALCNAPERFERRLEPWPAGANIVPEPAIANLTVFFVTSQAELVHDLRPLVKSLPAKAALWIAWPKRTAKVPSDLKDSVVREFGLAEGWVDYKVCAIDETWSALCFAKRAK
ncbi:MAG: hypothetical protein JO356_05040 [Acidobacteria bacterium]|nr:hypothetical protein [Acidobacteriota bacterium]